MKLALFSTLIMATAVLGTQQPQKSVIISYPTDTPDSIVTQAMDAIKSAGGMITHEYKLIKYVHSLLLAPCLTYVQRICCKSTCQSPGIRPNIEYRLPCDY